MIFMALQKQAGKSGGDKKRGPRRGVRGSRRLAREAALQYLYQRDSGNPPEDFGFFWADWSAYHSGSKAGDKVVEPGDEDFVGRAVPGLDLEEAREYARQLVRGVEDNMASIDSIIARFSENFDLVRIMRTDRNIIRVGLYEIVFGGVPITVAINEAVEIAKMYGDSNSRRFVNGLLDRAGKLGNDALMAAVMSGSALDTGVFRGSAGTMIVLPRKDGRESSRGMSGSVE
jgi:N utilization substance protein B